jgi:prepilin-type processing-associated H-X9-DG protein
MTRPTHERDRMVRLLREYLLGTLNPAGHAEVERNLAASEAWRAALDLERRAIEQLDALPDTEPRGNLTDKVMAGVREEEFRRASRPSLSARIVPYAVAASLLCIMAGLLVPGLTRAREAARRATSENNLKQIGLALKMYANESEGEKYPPLTQYDGVWMLDLEKLYPEFLSDVTVLVNPSHPQAGALREEMEAIFTATPIDYEAATRIAAKSYTYAGWVMEGEEDARLVQMARAGLGPDGLDEDIKIAGATVPRLREGVERFLITDINNAAGSAAAQSLVPVMFEAIESAEGQKGINVLYMDGHVEFVPLGTKFPALESVGVLFGRPDPPPQ